MRIASPHYAGFLMAIASVSFQSLVSDVLYFYLIVRHVGAMGARRVFAVVAVVVCLLLFCLHVEQLFDFASAVCFFVLIGRGDLFCILFLVVFFVVAVGTGELFLYHVCLLLLLVRVSCCSVLHNLSVMVWLFSLVCFPQNSVSVLWTT